MKVSTPRAFTLLLIAAAAATACKRENPLYCDTEADCLRKVPHLPYCDVEGEWGDHIGNQCKATPRPVLDAGTVDAGAAVDANASIDAGVDADARTADAASEDVSSADIVAVDAASDDAGSIDAHVDAGTMDTGTADASSADATTVLDASAPADATTVLDAAAPDLGPTDALTPDVVVADAVVDTGVFPIDAATIDAGSPIDTGPVDTGVLPLDPRLSGLELVGADLTPAFSSSNTGYTANVGFLLPSIRVIARVTNTTRLTITLNGATLASGAESPTIYLVEGQNLVRVVVTNDTGTERAYDVFVTRRAQSTVTGVLVTDEITIPEQEYRDLVGWDVAIDGDRLVTGAPFHDVNGISDAGSAFVLERDSAGAWTEAAQLVASDASTSAQLGYDVAIDGDTVVLAAPGVHAAYVFRRLSSGVWTQSAKLQPAGAAAASFGADVAIDGNTIVVGAPDGNNGLGAAYVFTRNNLGSWSQRTTLTPASGAAGMGFGGSVAIDDNTIIVGSSGDDQAPADNCGAVHVFVRDSQGSWQRNARLLARDRGAEDRLGASVAIDGDTIVAGATGHDHSSAGRLGAAFVFTRDTDGVWAQNTELRTNAEAFGTSVAIDGDTVAVGAPDNDLTDGAYVFLRNSNGTWGTGWRVPRPSNIGTSGFVASLSRDSLVVAAWVAPDGKIITGVMLEVFR